MSRRAILPLILLLAYGLFIFSPLIADPDLWGHVRFGQDLLRSGQIVRPDPYSYLSSGQPWINHEWLSELSLALAYELGGAGGVSALNIGLALLTLILLYARLVARGMGAWGAALMMAGFALLLRPGVLNARPQVWTYLLLTLLALVIERVAWAESTGGGPGYVQAGWAVAAIMFVWVNAHGGVLAGAGVLALWAGARLVTKRDWRAVGLLVFAGAVLLLNPYGVGLLTFLLRTATAPRPEIADWEPARLRDVWSQLWLAGVAVTAAAVALSRRPRRWPLLLPLAAVAALPLLSVRHIPLFAVAAPALAADHFAGAWQRVTAPRARKMPGWIARASPVVAAALTVVLVVLAAPQLGIIRIDPAVAGFPVRAVAVMQAAAVEGNLAVEFNWGEYVIWRLGPRVRVSVDGRRETVYSEAVYQENLDFMLGEGEWDRLIDKPETDMALVDRTRPVYQLMREKAGWVLAYEDEAAALFVQEGSPWLGRLAGVGPPDWPADGASLAFPAE